MDLLTRMRLTSPPPATRASHGVLTTLVLLRDDGMPAKKRTKSEQQVDAMVAEAVLAMRLLRDRMRPALPCALVADGTAWAHLGTMGLHTLWDRWIGLPDPAQTTTTMLAGLPQRQHARPGEVAWLFKFAALLLSPFNATVYMDLDVLVLSQTLIADLLHHTLRVADLAFPHDPAREPREYPTFHRIADFGRGVPPMCAGLLAFRLTPSVSRLLERAADALLRRTVDLKALGFRNGDQEMIWHQLWTGGLADDSSLRMMQLPEEYFCPFRRGRERMHQLGPSLDGPVLAAASWPRWVTSWGKYRCKALHGHINGADLHRTNLSQFALQRSARWVPFRWSDHPRGKVLGV